jgi:hypothetical protein
MLAATQEEARSRPPLPRPNQAPASLQHRAGSPLASRSRATTRASAPPRGERGQHLQQLTPRGSSTGTSGSGRRGRGSVPCRHYQHPAVPGSLSQLQGQRPKHQADPALGPPDPATETGEPPPVAIVAASPEEDDTHRSNSHEGEKRPRNRRPCTGMGFRPCALAAARKRAVGMGG